MPVELLKRLDKVAYGNRSRYIRELIEKELSKKEG
jgi:metal-responsive CopG/Arc/MetJ family transcriptional regulator